MVCLNCVQSQFWFMTKSSDAPKVADFFRSLGQEVDKESYAVTIEELKKAPFEVYITEQKLGDLVIVPSRSCHQVVNTGGLTVKASWSRMTLKGVATAIRHELPIYRRFVGIPSCYGLWTPTHDCTQSLSTRDL